MPEVIDERLPESSDILIYLAGVNEHAVLRIVGSKRWERSTFSEDNSVPFEYGVRFLAARFYRRGPDGLRRRKERNYFLFADHPPGTKSTVRAFEDAV